MPTTSSEAGTTCLRCRTWGDNSPTFETIPVSSFVDEDTGASDVSIDPTNPRIVFAGMWEARRSPWSLVSGGDTGGIFLSRDGGDTWKKVEGKGLPEGLTGKIAVDVAPSDPRRVYALIEAESGGIFAPTTAGRAGSS